MSRLQAKDLHQFWVDEVPTGTVNGSNVTFTLAQTPLENGTTEPSVDIFLDGLKCTFTTDYTISGVTITMVVAPAVGQKITVNYIRNSGGA